MQTSPSNLEEYLRIEDIAKMIQVSRSTIYRWMDEDCFPKPFRFGPPDKRSTIRWKRSHIEEWINGQD